MSHSIASLAWLQRAAQVTLPTSTRNSADAPAPVAAAALAAPASGAQELAQAVQAATRPEPVVAPQAPVTETPVARSEVDPAVQQFTQALMFALHRAGRERDEDGGHGRHSGRQPGHGHGDDDGGERWHRRDGARAYRDMDTLVRRLGDLAAQIRRGDAPVAPAPAPSAPAPNASPVAPVDVPVPTPPMDAVAAPAAATAATAQVTAPALPAARPQPLQRLLDAFSALGGTAPPAATPAPPATAAADAPSARERLARFLEQLAQALAAPGQRAANDACGCSPRGRLLNVAA